MHTVVYNIIMHMHPTYSHVFNKSTEKGPQKDHNEHLELRQHRQLRLYWLAPESRRIGKSVDIISIYRYRKGSYPPLFVCAPPEVVDLVSLDDVSHDSNVDTSVHYDMFDIESSSSDGELSLGSGHPWEMEIKQRKR